MQFDDFDLNQDGAHPSLATRLTQDPLVRLQYLIQNTPAIIYSSVPTGDFKMTFVSDNAQRILGYRSQDMVDDPNFWFDHIHPDDIPQIFSSLALIFSEGERVYEYRFRKSDGNYIWMHDSLRVICDEQGRPIEVIGSLLDITERKQMEEILQRTGEEQKELINNLQATKEQLLQSEKMASIGQLAAGVAHEINNPVGFVNSNLGSLKKYADTLFSLLNTYDEVFQEMPNTPEMIKRLANIKKNADIEFLLEDVNDLLLESLDGLKRVKDIVQSLKDFSHVGESEWNVADLHEGLNSTLNIVNNELKYKADIVKAYGDIPQIMCLASQLNQVFMNILVNAGHAIEGRGVITITTGVQGDMVFVSIADTGKGVAPEHLNRLFDPFFTTKPIGQGTGLGLSLSYGIVAKHKGRIEVESEVGKGTCFTIFIPVADSASR
jgi:PAS domain S-box-containing protein